MTPPLPSRRRPLTRTSLSHARGPSTCNALTPLVVAGAAVDIGVWHQRQSAGHGSDPGAAPRPLPCCAFVLVAIRSRFAVLFFPSRNQIFVLFSFFFFAKKKRTTSARVVCVHALAGTCHDAAMYALSPLPSPPPAAAKLCLCSAETVWFDFCLAIVVVLLLRF